jgi:hypothetical protein
LVSLLVTFYVDVISGMSALCNVRPMVFVMIPR